MRIQPAEPTAPKAAVDRMGRQPAGAVKQPKHVNRSTECSQKAPRAYWNWNRRPVTEPKQVGKPGLRWPPRCDQNHRGAFLPNCAQNARHQRKRRKGIGKQVGPTGGQCIDRPRRRIRHRTHRYGESGVERGCKEGHMWAEPHGLEWTQQSVKHGPLRWQHHVWQTESDGHNVQGARHVTCNQLDVEALAEQQDLFRCEGER